MKQYLQEMRQCALFTDIKEQDLLPMLACLGGYVRSYHKGEFLVLFEEKVQCVGAILQGQVHMLKEDIWGNRTALAYIKQGGIFGESFACGSQSFSTVTFYAATNCVILYLPFHKIVHECDKACAFHQQLVENMIYAIANKNVQLMEKAEVISKKSLREKILSYLSLQAQKNQSMHFVVPLSRLEMADYLCADRSALTRELNHMRQDGLIAFDKNEFWLNKGH